MWHLQFDEDISFVKSAQVNSPASWRAGITRTDLPFLPQSRVTITGYNAYESQGETYAGFILGYLPLFDGRLAVNINTDLSLERRDGSVKKVKVTGSSVRMDVNFHKTLSLYGGITRNYSDYVDSTLYEIGVDRRW